MKIKIVYIISFIDKALAFEWIVKHINSSKYHLSFVLLNPGNSSLEDFLIQNNVSVHRIKYHGKKDILKAFLLTVKHLLKTKPNVVHTHLFDANLVGLSSALFCRIKHRIHTRHNSTIHHEYFPKAVKFDKLSNMMSTKIVAISDNVQKILVELENVRNSKIEVIHHGFDFPPINDKLNHEIKEKYNFERDNYYIGVVSRFIHWKGIQYIISAFKKFYELNPTARLILANADGPDKAEIDGLLKALPPNSFLTIKFEPEIFALFQQFDVFVHTPIDEKAEAFGQVYIESLACQVPMIATKSGIASEILVDKENSLLVPFKDDEAIFQALKTIYSDHDLRVKIINNGKELALREFSIDKMIKKLERLYDPQND